MFRHILAPVDLAHVEGMRYALDCAADLARHWNAPVTYASGTTALPGKIAHTPAEFAEKLQTFADNEASKHGIEAHSHPITTPDITTDLDGALLRAVGLVKADLVVMASHVPTAMDHIWPSHGGKLASNAACSVMIVRK